MMDLRCSFLVVSSGKPPRQIEAHLMAEDRQGADAGAVALFHALGEHAFHQIEILAHRLFVFASLRLVGEASLTPNEERTKGAQVRWIRSVYVSSNASINVSAR